MCYSCYGFDRNHELVLHTLVLQASMWLCLFSSISSLHGKDPYIVFGAQPNTDFSIVILYDHT